MRRLMLGGNLRSLLLIISLAFNFGLCLAMAVQGREDPTRRHPWGDGQRHCEHLSDQLGLSPQQAEALASSREQLFDELRPLKRQLHDESDTLAGLLTAAELDMNAVSAQVEKVAELRNEIQWRMIEHILGIRELLEPGQLESLKEFAGRVLSRSERGGPPGDRPPKPDERGERAPEGP